MRISFIVRYVYTYEEFAIVTNMNAGYTFTFMHLADAFIQSDLPYIQVMRAPCELNPQPFALLTQCHAMPMSLSHRNTARR